MNSPGILAILRCMLTRDLILAIRRLSDVLTTLFFFVIVVSLFPLGVGTDMEMLRAIAPGIVWVAALLASMLALGRLFSEDFADGTLEQLILTPQPLSVLVFSKIIAHWLVTGLPLVLIAPLIGLQYDLPAGALWTLVLSLLVGTPVLSLIGAIGAALTLGLRGGGVLISLLILPLYVPVLVYGAGVVDAGISGLNTQSHFLLLSAFLVIALVLSPPATAAALRISIE